MFEFNVKIHGADKLRRMLDPKVMEMALVSATNATATKARTAAIKKVAETYTIKSKDVRASTTLRKEYRKYGGRFYATLASHGRPIALSKYGAKQRKKGVSVRVKKSRGRKTLPGAFLATMKSGHVGVFQRTGKQRLPIDQRYGPSIPQLFGSKRVVRTIRNIVEGEGPKILKNQYEWAWRG